MRKTAWYGIARCGALLLALGWVGCGGGSSDSDDGSGTFGGVVRSAEGTVVAGAKVYLVPTSSIDTTEITATAVYTSPYPAEAYDEPLEDTVAASGTDFARATTDGSGNFSISPVPGGHFFVYVEPAAGDTEHLPGGDKCRSAYSADTLRGASWTIKMSSQPSSTATYIGMTSCLTCHSNYEGAKKTAHKNGIMPANDPGDLQDPSNYPDFFDGLSKFKSAADYTGGLRLELGDYDSSRGFDKFKIRELGDTEKVSITTVYANLWLWKSTGNGKYYITVENKLNAGDANNLKNLEVKFTYGGAVYKQRYLLDVSPLDSDRAGLYYTLQYNVEGSNGRWDRNRRVWRDYKFGDFWKANTDADVNGSTYGDSDDTIGAPTATKTFQGECAACHFTGYERYTAGTDSEYLARAGNDASGEANVDDDAGNDEMNVSCEACHGPGSEHMASNSARYIVTPRKITPERDNMICGRCHDRPNGKTGNEQPISDTTLKMMLPGQSRATFLANFCQTTKKGPKPATDASPEVWGDDQHSKSHHQQYSDFIKSEHYRNDRKLVACSDCHDLHGGSEYRHQLNGNPDNSDSTLCQTCHNRELLSHMQAKTGSYMAGYTVTCVKCHMPKTSQSGSGRYGMLVSVPPYTSSSDESSKVYWENDISAHLFHRASKFNVSVDGIPPGGAMPVPYTSSCGTCHEVNQLQYP